MARLARVVVPGRAHHVTQRGNRRQQTFFNDDDYRAYLELMAEWSVRYGLRIWSYCLMPNHVHLIVVPGTADGLCRGIGEVHRRYTRRVNFREGWRGHLWQGRFASFVMDGSHLLRAARYIELNPVKAGLVERPEDWPWSSASCHMSGRGDALAEVDWLAERTSGWVCDWREYLASAADKDFAALMRHHENTGRPLGDETFLKKIGSLIGRSILPKKAGRPRKKKN